MSLDPNNLSLAMAARKAVEDSIERNSKIQLTADEVGYLQAEDNRFPELRVTYISQTKEGTSMFRVFAKLRSDWILVMEYDTREGCSVYNNERVGKILWFDIRRSVCHTMVVVKQWNPVKREWKE